MIAVVELHFFGKISKFLGEKLFLHKEEQNEEEQNETDQKT